MVQPNWADTASQDVMGKIICHISSTADILSRVIEILRISLFLWFALLNERLAEEKLKMDWKWIIYKPGHSGVDHQDHGFDIAWYKGGYGRSTVVK